MLSLRVVKRQDGVGLIEVLASLLVLSVGILGVVGLQSRAVQFNQGALYETRAAILAADMADRIRANKDSIGVYADAMGNCEQGASSVSYSPQCFGSTASCAGGALANDDKNAWRSDLGTLFPGGGEFEIAVFPQGGGSTLTDVTITIRYNDSRVESANVNAGNVSCRSVVFETVI